MNPKVADYLSKLKNWRDELTHLRAILLACPVTEEFKWGKPCYTFQGSNIAVMCALKESCTLGFLKGALLKDAQGILLKPGEHSQSMRWVKFTSVCQIAELEPVLRAYIDEAIAAEKAGLKVSFADNKKLVLPTEFKKKLAENPALKKAFQALTPGRQRAYNIYFSGAKQSQTRESRIAQYTERILSGKGLNDCVCGLSKRYPQCDGSHKNIR